MKVWQNSDEAVLAEIIRRHQAAALNDIREHLAADGKAVIVEIVPDHLARFILAAGYRRLDEAEIAVRVAKQAVGDE